MPAFTAPSPGSAAPLDALVVLGCRVGEGGVLSAPAERRVRSAAAAFASGHAPLVIASGGKRWSRLSEAEAFQRRLLELGVPEPSLRLESRSMNTRQNARFTVELLRAEQLTRLGVVTCEWHMQRALSAFEHYGFRATAFPATTPRDQDRLRRVTEGLRRIADRCLLTFSPGTSPE